MTDALGPIFRAGSEHGIMSGCCVTTIEMSPDELNEIVNSEARLSAVRHVVKLIKMQQILK